MRRRMFLGRRIFVRENSGYCLLGEYVEEEEEEEEVSQGNRWRMFLRGIS